MTALQVASEDTVLYTARQYVGELEDDEQWNRAQQLLAPLVRCPHLSRYWLSGEFHAADEDETLLSGLRSHMKQLLLLRDVQGDFNVKAANLQEGGLLAGAPPSWALGCRVSKPVSRVKLVWQLDICELRDAAHRCAADGCTVELCSPTVTPPLQGTEFSMSLECDSEEGGVGISLYGHPCNLYAGMFYHCTLKVHVKNVITDTAATPQPHRFGDDYMWWEDFFGVGRMAGAWDEVAWAKAGLPTSGQVTIKMTVSGMPHTAVPAARAPVGRGRANRQQ